MFFTSKLPAPLIIIGLAYSPTMARLHVGYRIQLYMMSLCELEQT